MVHIIPRKEGDGLNFEIPQRKMSQHAIDEAGEKIISTLNFIPGAEETAPRAESMGKFMPRKPIEAEFEEVKDKKPKAKKARTEHKEETKNSSGKSSDEKAVSDINLDDIAKLLGGK